MKAKNETDKEQDKSRIRAVRQSKKYLEKIIQVQSLLVKDLIEIDRELENHMKRTEKSEDS